VRIERTSRTGGPRSEIEPGADIRRLELRLKAPTVADAAAGAAMRRRETALTGHLNGSLHYGCLAAGK
jgi:hypothetical protein